MVRKISRRKIKASARANSLIYAVITDVAGERVSVATLGSSAGRLTSIPCAIDNPQVGEHVIVDYSSGRPLVRARK